MGLWRLSQLEVDVIQIYKYYESEQHFAQAYSMIHALEVEECLYYQIVS